MKIAYSILVSDARGTAGSIVATSGLAGPMLRGRSPFRAAVTLSQEQVRGAFATVAEIWRSGAMLTYRFDWNVLGQTHPEADVFGNFIYKSGYSWFVRANKTRQTFGLAPILAAPAFTAAADPASLTLVHVPGPPEHLTVTPAVAPNAADGVIIKATKGMSPGRSTPNNGGVIITTIAPVTTGPWDVITEYTAKLGAPVVGLQIFVEVYYVHSASGYPGKKRFTGTVI